MDALEGHDGGEMLRAASRHTVGFGDDDDRI